MQLAVRELSHMIAPIIGFVTLLIGFSAVIWPKAMSKKFGIEMVAGELPYVVSTGIRDVFIGLMILILFYYQNWKLIGAACLCVTIVAVSDFWVVYRYGDRRTSWVHLFGAVTVFGYGLWLLV